MAKTFETSTATVPASWEAMIAWNGPMLSAAGQAGDAYLEIWRDWQQEMARFMDRRLEENRRHRQSLSECQSLGELAKAQQDWSRNALQAYIDEFGRLPQLAAKFFQNGGMQPAETAVAQTQQFERSVRREAREAAE